MTIPAIVYLGAVDPELLEVTLTPRESGLNFSLVSSASLSVLKQGATTPVIWMADILTQSATLLVLTHVYALVDLPSVGAYTVVPLIVIAGKTYRCLPRKIVCQDIYA